ncbi:hypothetical protein, partial [Clostridium tarantellae]
MKIKKLNLIFLFLLLLLAGCDEMSGPTERIEVVNNPIEVIEDDKKPIEVKFRDTYKQFRNNKKNINNKELNGLTFNDETFANFKDTNMDIKEYEEWFLKNAAMKGINKDNLKLALNKVNLSLDDKLLKYPIIIDTIIFKNKECYAIAYTWDYKENVKDKTKLKKVCALNNKMI